MSDGHYLSIGEVLGLLLEDFPDVTISKIRFLESQGLIEPERTPSGYRKFYDHDVDLLRTILHQQRENFLPLKVIRDRIESGGIQADATGGRTPPRGIRNVEMQATATSTEPAAATEPRDSVFRRTDGGPEWADGRALIPGGLIPGGTSSTPITTSVPVTASVPQKPVTAAPVPSVATAPPPPPPASAKAAPEPAPKAAAPAPAPAPAAKQSDDPTLPYNREELCAAAHITTDQLDELESFGLITARSGGRDAGYAAEMLDVATVAGRFLANGIDARHLRSWRQSADRESALFEQRIVPLLRQRNPASRQLALDTLTELAELGGRLRNTLMDATLRHHFDGT